MTLSRKRPHVIYSNQNRAGLSFLKMQEVLLHRCKKSGKAGKRETWMSQHLLTLKGKKEMHRSWKQGQVSWEEYEDAASCIRMGSGRSKFIWSFFKQGKTSKKSFYRFISQKKKVKERALSLISKSYKLVKCVRIKPWYSAVLF